ncbi:MAG: mandelate racemase/muconate lactonizing enzyme family protein [Pseudomonadota bacterium]
MRIVKVESHIHRTPFTFGASVAGAGGNLHLRNMDTLLVRVETDTGLHGWGEGFGFTLVDTTCDALDRLVAPACIGEDARDIAGLGHRLQRRLHNFGRNGAASFAIAAIDIALWDIAAKAAGKPLHALLGSAARRSVPAYASLLRYGNPDDVARNTRAAVDAGYRRVKLHEVDLACIRAARAAAPADIPLMLDINCAWNSVAEARDFCASVAGMNIAWVEEPVWPPEDFPAIAAVRAGGPCPISAGECTGSVAELGAMIAAGAVDVVQPSVSKLGLSAMLAVGKMAREAGIRMVPHSPYFGPGLLATLHLLAATEAEEPIEVYYADLDSAPYADALNPIGGTIAVPPGIGLGLEPVL